jgi:HSP20 family protein
MVCHLKNRMHKTKIIMTLVKFNHRPFQGSFNNFVDDLFAELPVFHKNGFDHQWKSSVPVNIKETDKNYSIEIVAPGFEKTDFKISLEQQLLTISAEKKTEVKENQDNNPNEKQIRKEYSYRSFKRSFTLGEKADGANIDAKYVNGVLTLNLAKKEEVKPSVKEINIQ